MEERDDLERLLLDGLPAAERDQVRQQIAQVTEHKRRQVQAQIEADLIRSERRSRDGDGSAVGDASDDGDLLDA